jgi:hypothetical protein
MPRGGGCGPRSTPSPSATTFDTVAERYDAVRPRFPRGVVDDLVALAGLHAGGRHLGFRLLTETAREWVLPR